MSKASETVIGGWSGVYCILTTPFKPDLTLDLGGYRKNVEHAISGGVDVLVTMGTQGEFYALDLDERLAILDATVEAAAGRVPIIAGTASNDFRVTLSLHRRIRELEIDAAMLLPPTLVQPTPASMARYLDGLQEEVAVNIVLYNAPSRVGFGWSPDNLAELAQASARTIGVKQADLDAQIMSDTVERCRGKMAVIGGSEAVFFQSLALGMVGCTSTTATAVPKPFVEIADLVASGRLGDAQAAHYRLAPLRDAIRKFGHAAAVKILLDEMGLAGGPLRPPLPAISDEARRGVTTAARAAGL